MQAWWLLLWTLVKEQCFFQSFKVTYVILKVLFFLQLMENSKEQLDTCAVKSGLTSSSLCKAFILSIVVIIYFLYILRTWVKGSQCSLTLICKRFQFCNFGDSVSRSLDLKWNLHNFGNALLLKAACAVLSFERLSQN